MVKDLTISVIYWIIFILLLTTFRFWGIEFFFDVPSEFSMKLIYTNSLISGFVLGLTLGLFDLMGSKQVNKKRRSFGILVISKTIIYLIILILITFFSAWIQSGSLELAKGYVVSKISFGNTLAFIIAAFLYHFFKQMNRKFGPGTLIKYLTGKYFNPIEENRIFMFLDLKSSTTIAEKLSHILYSKLIQDCFSELTVPVINHKAEIYQYVGDEAVITWGKGNGLDNASCINFYFSFINRLEDKKDYFLNTYGVFPKFKAGISLGFVTVAEVGELKTEIAYHGDVLNTASRIQGYCNKLNKQLLVSESLANELEKYKHIEIQPVGEVELKGKEGKSKIYSIDKLEQATNVIKQTAEND
jgi:adenylate cyclase